MTDTLPIYTVYENPSDYPGRIVVRLCEVTMEGMSCVPRMAPEPLAVVDTLDEAREAIRRVHPGAAWIQRAPEDDDPIVECWL